MSLRGVIRSAAPIFGWSVFVVTAVSVAPAVAATGGSVLEKGIGSVHMPISCSADATSTFDRGLALLHSFWYDRALETFDRVIASDPDCTIAYWGAAMTFNHPLWAPPTPTDIKSALRYIARSASGRERSDREAMYLSAVTALLR